MNNLTTIYSFSLVVALVFGFPVGPLSAVGFKGGGGGRGGPSLAGGGRPGGGVHAPAARPASRPSVPSMGAARPNLGVGAARPNVNIPSGSVSASSRPSPMPAAANRPTGGMKPSTSNSSPTRLPGTKLPSLTRPADGAFDLQRPSFGGGVMTNKPKPSLPSLGAGEGGTRPSNKLPPRAGVQGRPDFGGIIDHPSTSRPAVNFPSSLPGTVERPSAGSLGDFLGMDKPLRPQILPGTTAPGGVALADRRGPLDRPDIGNKSINIGQINVTKNTVINNKMSWANIDRNQINAINNRWQNQIGSLSNWNTRNPHRISYWAGWGNGVRGSWGHYYHHNNWFGPDWWAVHSNRWCGWHYGVNFGRHPWTYWWTVPTYTSIVRAFVWQPSSTVWSQPIYYDYGQAGNVVYQNNNVFINGQPVATSDEFAQSAGELATVAPPANDDEAAREEWMPLGTFAVTTDQTDTDPTRVVQLAVSKQGIVSGTLFNNQTDETHTVQGRVDRQTQRVAMRIGDSDRIVVETGIYNLTQDDCPILVHFGTETTENWLLVRMPVPAELP